MTIQEMYRRMDDLKIAVCGDYCLDVYWTADMKRSVLSRETPEFPLPIVEERMSPGGAGNVALNVSSLKPNRVYALGVTGKDWRAEALRSALSGAGVDICGLQESSQRVTNCYIKPLRKGYGDVVYEAPRLDFENDSPLDENTEELLLQALRQTDADVICVSDQMQYGCITPKIRKTLCEMGQNGRLIIVDSRERIGFYEHVIVKPNEVEAARATSEERSFEEMARLLSEKTHCPALITLGENGCLICEGKKTMHIPAIKTTQPVDICGAGDTFLSAFACAYGAGATLEESVTFANRASAVTIRKLHTTGTASRDEIAGI